MFACARTRRSRVRRVTKGEREDDRAAAVRASNVAMSELEIMRESGARVRCVRACGITHGRNERGPPSERELLRECSVKDIG